MRVLDRHMILAGWTAAVFLVTGIAQIAQELLT